METNKIKLEYYYEETKWQFIVRKMRRGLLLFKRAADKHINGGCFD